MIASSPSPSLSSSSLAAGPVTGPVKGLLKGAPRPASGPVALATEGARTGTGGAGDRSELGGVSRSDSFAVLGASLEAGSKAGADVRPSTPISAETGDAASPSQPQPASIADMQAALQLSIKVAVQVVADQSVTEGVQRTPVSGSEEINVKAPAELETASRKDGGESGPNEIPGSGLQIAAREAEPIRQDELSRQAFKEQPDDERPRPANLSPSLPLTLVSEGSASARGQTVRTIEQTDLQAAKLPLSGTLSAPSPEPASTPVTLPASDPLAVTVLPERQTLPPDAAPKAAVLPVTQAPELPVDAPLESGKALPVGSTVPREASKDTGPAVPLRGTADGASPAPNSTSAPELAGVSSNAAPLAQAVLEIAPADLRIRPGDSAYARLPTAPEMRAAPRQDALTLQQMRPAAQTLQTNALPDAQIQAVPDLKLDAGTGSRRFAARADSPAMQFVSDAPPKDAPNAPANAAMPAANTGLQAVQNTQAAPVSVTPLSASMQPQAAGLSPDKPAVPQAEQAIDQLLSAREASRSARPEITMRHAEFGAVNMRLETIGTELRATLTNRDPGFVPAIQAALADRAVAAASETSSQSGGQSGSRQSESGSSGGNSNAANTGNWGPAAGSQQNYGSFLGGEKGPPQPSSEHLGNEGQTGLSRSTDNADGSVSVTSRDRGLFA